MYGKYRLSALVIAVLAFSGTASGHANYTGYSGAPGRSTCASSCHGTSGGTITATGFPATYVPGQNYTVTVKYSSGSRISNFNCSIRVGTGTVNAGTITAGLNTSTYNVTGETNGIHFASNNQDSGKFTWTAPAVGTGTVRLYLGGLQGSVNGPNTTIVQVSSEQTTTHDVGCTRILVPTGTIDTNQSVTPACTVYNYGTATESYRVRMKVGSFYNDTARVTNHAAGTRVYLTFPAYSAWPRGTFSVTCSTELAGDGTPANDKQTGSVTVRVHDVSCVSLRAPSGSIDSGTVVTPACTVVNFGTVAESYRMRMKIGSFYNDTARITSQAAGARTYVTFPSWTALTVGGPYAVTCSTELTGDAKTSNDKATGSVTITRPAIHDVGCTRILAPAGTIDSTASVTPACSVYNYGNQTESYRVRLKVGTFYNDTARVTSHAPGTRTYVTFPAYGTWPRGTFSVTCSTELAGDGTPANDKQAGSVTVNVRDVGVSTLLAPSGTVDSPTVVTPACTVTNYGSTVESYRIRMKIGTFYNDTARVTSQAAGSKLRVTFPNWTANQVGGPYAVTCSTELATDMKAVNNKATGSVTVTRPALHDVGCTRILAPAGTIDTGQSVTPACSVYNYGNQTESYRVRLKVGTFYNDTARVTSHAAGAKLYVTFPAYSAWPRGTFSVTCSTELAGDATPSNDKQTGSVTVRVHDVACLALLAPSGTVDSGTTVAPACSVVNYGTVAETYKVKVKIGSFYSDSATVTAQAAGARTYVTFPNWDVTQIGGPYTVSCSTALAEDANTANDKQTGVVLVTRPVRDVGATEIIAPVDTVDTGATIIPAALVRNFGELEETFSVRFTIGSFYSADTSATVAAGATDTVRFREWVVGEIGMHIVRCSTMLAGDQNPSNNRVQDTVVVPGVGVEELPALVPTAFALAGCAPNPFSHSTVIRFAVPRQTGVGLHIYSAAGALVRVLCNSSLLPAHYSLVWNGRDDKGRAVAPGIYYCRLRAAGYSATRKLTMTR